MSRGYPVLASTEQGFYLTAKVFQKGTLLMIRPTLSPATRE
jgi:hypothetical protein